MIEVKLSFQTQAAMLAFFATTAAAVSAPEKEAVSAIAAPKPAGTPAATVEAPVAKTTTATESPSDPKPAAAATSAASTASSAKPDESADGGAIEYATVAAAITSMVKTNREHAVATLAQFGCKKGTELKAEQFADFLKALG